MMLSPFKRQRPWRMSSIIRRTCVLLSGRLARRPLSRSAAIGGLIAMTVALKSLAPGGAVPLPWGTVEPVETGGARTAGIGRLLFRAKARTRAVTLRPGCEDLAGKRRAWPGSIAHCPGLALASWAGLGA